MSSQTRSIVTRAALLALLAPALQSRAQFSAFEGGAAQEAAWRAAAGGNVPLENFEGFRGTPFGGSSDHVTALPALGIFFTTDVPGTDPGVYADAPYAHSGTNQLANFGAGMAQFSSYYIHPEPGKAIFALGFWQCDPQGNQPMIAYDAAGNQIGEIVGHINDHSGQSFAGFVSTVPIAKVTVVGVLGDGYNHIDDLQIVARRSCPADFDSDGTVDFFDYDAFVICFEGGSCPPGKTADFDGDGSVDFFDYDAFVVAFESGC